MTAQLGLLAGTAFPHAALDAPCQKCATTRGFIAPGVGPHAAAVRCEQGHFQKWLPKPRLVPRSPPDAAA